MAEGLFYEEKLCTSEVFGIWHGKLRVVYYKHMNTYQKTSLFLLRVSLGWYMLYAGLTKVFDPAWSAAGYLRGAKNFTEMYGFFASPNVLPITNFLNEWGLTLIGLSLVFGILIRVSAVFGAMLMLFYYLALSFPHPDAYTYVVDEHLVYAGAFLVLAACDAQREKVFKNLLLRVWRR